MNPSFLYSSRLLFIAGSPDLLTAELADIKELASIFNVAIPADWPPGEYDQDAMQFFLDQLLAGGKEVVGWYNWYVIWLPTDTEPATLVAGGGYFGPPDAAGTLEIGYSVSDPVRRRGIATELVASLVHHAQKQANVKRIIAHTLPNNEASIRVLIKNGFKRIASDDPERLLFEHQKVIM